MKNIRKIIIAVTLAAVMAGATLSFGSSNAWIKPVPGESRGTIYNKFITAIDTLFTNSEVRVSALVSAINDTVMTVDNIAQLRLLDGTPGPFGLLRTNSVQVLGYYTKGDGGGGPLRILAEGAAGTYTENAGSVIFHTDVIDGRSAWVWASQSILNIKFYGAKVDGVTNDEIAITNAFIDVGTHGNVVFFPIGTTFVNPTAVSIKFFSGTTFRGVKGLSKIKRGSDTTDCFRTEGAVTGIVIEDLILEDFAMPLGSFSNRAFFRMFVADPEYHSDIVVRGNTFIGDTTIFRTDASRGVRVYNNIFKPLRAGVPALFIISATFDNLSEDVYVYDNVFEAVGVGEIDDSNYLSLGFASNIGIHGTGVYVYNNIIKGYSRNAIDLEGTIGKDVHLYSNTILATPGFPSTGSAINVRVHDEIYIYSNTITGNGITIANGINIDLNGTDIPVLASIYNDVGVYDNTITGYDISTGILMSGSKAGSLYSVGGSINIVDNDISAKIPISSNLSDFTCTSAVLNIKRNTNTPVVGQTSSAVEVNSGAVIVAEGNEKLSLLVSNSAGSDLYLNNNTGTGYPAYNRGIFSASFAGTTHINETDMMTVYGAEIDLSETATNEIVATLDPNATYELIEFGLIVTEATSADTGVRLRVFYNNNGVEITAKFMDNPVSADLYSVSSAFYGTLDKVGVLPATLRITSPGGKIGAGKVVPYVKALKYNQE